MNYKWNNEVLFIIINEILFIIINEVLLFIIINGVL